jgi:hypothetical protein
MRRPISPGLFVQAQSQAVVKGVRLSLDEKPFSRCMILDSDFQVIAIF